MLLSVRYYSLHLEVLKESLTFHGLVAHEKHNKNMPSNYYFMFLFPCSLLCIYGVLHQERKYSSKFFSLYMHKKFYFLQAEFIFWANNLNPPESITLMDSIKFPSSVIQMSLKTRLIIGTIYHRPLLLFKTLANTFSIQIKYNPWLLLFWHLLQWLNHVKKIQEQAPAISSKLNCVFVYQLFFTVWPIMALFFMFGLVQFFRF